MNWLLAFLILFNINLALAEDDLLSILENDSAEALVEEHSELEQVLRKEIDKVSAEQNIFLSFLRKNQYEKALFQWSAAFTDTEFSKTATGRSLYAYILLKNKLPVTAVEMLFSVKKIDELPKLLKQLWRLELPSEHKVWQTAQINWQSEWRDVFGLNIEVAVLSRQEFDLEKKKEIFELLKKSKLKTKNRYWLEWQMALSLAMNGEVAKSAKVLAHLLKEQQSMVSKDLITITAARLLYERGYLDAAIEYYKKIGKDSEYWFASREEMAWTYMRKGLPQDTLAIAKTQMISEFAPHTGPEMIFLKSLAHLKLCDYKDAAQALYLYKARFHPRAKNLIRVRDQGLTPATEKLVSALKKGRVKLLKLGSQANEIPRYLSRDEYLMDLVQSYAALEGEAKVAGDLYARSLSGGTAEVGFQAFLEDFKHSVERRLQTAKSATYNLIKSRAKQELAEINSILQKMHIVEAELIQQTSMTQRVGQASTKSKSSPREGTIKKAGKYDMVFPFEGEKWFDELSNYKIDINKACEVGMVKKDK